MLGLGLKMAENGLLPETITRFGIRGLLRRRLNDERALYRDNRHSRIAKMIAQINNGPVAPVPEKANEQHYEVPSGFFELVLGRYLKYSSGYWSENTQALDESEAEMLGLTCRRAELSDGQDILELGCGWGSLTLWMAAHYPNSTIVAVSNSTSQREYIENRAVSEGLGNVEVITCDMNDFNIERQFDRVVSVEMFEHMRNYEELLRRISVWLKDDGKLFVHIFCHREYAYQFNDRGKGDWMARHFFTGGIMPSADLLHEFQHDIQLEEQWPVNGTHYARTCRAWLQNMSRHKNEIMDLFAETYGIDNARKWYGRWRLFFMACEELFAYRGGNEWFVTHYLFTAKQRVKK